LFGIMTRRCKLPLYLRNKREYFVLSIGNIRSLLIKNNSDIFNIAGFKKEMQEIKNIQKCLFYCGWMRYPLTKEMH